MRKQMTALIEEYAPDADTAWSWLRSMFEQGYTLAAGTGDMPVFIGHDVEIKFALRHGAMAWCVMARTPTPKVYHPDPVTAAVWWQVERGNHPPAEAEEPRIDDAMRDMMERQARAMQRFAPGIPNGFTTAIHPSNGRK